MPVVDYSQGLEINVADIKEMIQQVVFAASTDDARPVLTGVLMDISGEAATMAAADGFRLSVRKGRLSGPVAKPIHAIIPARALSELARITSDGDKSLKMVLPPGRGQVIFRLSDVELVSQLIEGNFPDYEQIIPRRCEDAGDPFHFHFFEGVQAGRDICPGGLAYCPVEHQPRR